MERLLYTTTVLDAGLRVLYEIAISVTLTLRTIYPPGEGGVYTYRCTEGLPRWLSG